MFLNLNCSISNVTCLHLIISVILVLCDWNNQLIVCTLWSLEELNLEKILCIFMETVWICIFPQWPSGNKFWWGMVAPGPSAGNESIIQHYQFIIPFPPKEWLQCPFKDWKTRLAVLTFELFIKDNKWRRKAGEGKIALEGVT